MGTQGLSFAPGGNTVSGWEGQLPSLPAAVAATRGTLSTLSRAPEVALAHPRAALARRVSVVAEGDVDKEVVVVGAAAPVGAGRGAPSAAGGRTGGADLAPAALRLSQPGRRHCRLRASPPKPRVAFPFSCPVGSPKPGPLSRRHHDQGR